MFPAIRPRRWPNNGAGFLLAQTTGSRLYLKHGIRWLVL